MCVYTGRVLNVCKDIDEGKFEETLKLLLLLVSFVLGNALESEKQLSARKRKSEYATFDISIF